MDRLVVYSLCPEYCGEDDRRMIDGQEIGVRFEPEHVVTRMLATGEIIKTKILGEVKLAFKHERFNAI